MTSQGTKPSSTSTDFALERYRYILQQIHTVNENLYRFLALYQTLATTLVGGALALFVGYRRWGLSASTARNGVIGLLSLTTVVAAFTAMLIVVGMLNWLDYRNEECDLTDEAVRPGFRTRPRTGNILRWYESYVLLFILLSVIAMWLFALLLILPSMN
jgi:ABC-type dipeptide/oligopeptide/nickel transport system permease component